MDKKLIGAAFEDPVKSLTLIFQLLFITYNKGLVEIKCLVRFIIY